LLKHNHQKGHSTVDRTRWRHNTTAYIGPAPRSCIGPRTCQGRPCLKLLSFIWGRHNCVRKIMFRFTCAVLWKLHG